MNKTRRTHIFALAVSLSAAASLPAQNYEVGWSTIDGGGIMSSTGGGWDLSGTIGQPDAGAAMTGGGWELAGGFWPGAIAGPTILRGDLNCDGVVNNQDIDGFILALFNPAGYSQQFPNCNILNGDFTGDGFVNNQDIDGFIAVLFGA